MKNTSFLRRVLSVVLTVAMVFSLVVPAVSAEQAKAETTRELTLTPMERSELEASRKLGQTTDTKGESNEAAYAPTDVVRVTIELEKAGTLAAGFKAEGIATNAGAKAYRESLKADQKAVTAKIESAIGGKLDVKWNLTLAANFISANVLYGQIEAIKAIDGVKDVFLENRYEPQKAEQGTEEPNNGSASYMIGSNLAWAEGYTGAGSKVAIIDTGADTEHLSFSGEALEYALAQNAEALGVSYDEYVASLNLLTVESIEAVKDQLNAPIGSGEAAYRNTKIGFGYNYVDNTASYIEHTNDSQGEHGSHVAGIATANRFVKVDDEFKPALEAVGTQGVAPDAQLVVMKVFGKGGGAYDSDYMVAIEDAIVLGCDSANLSLGSGAVGFGFSDGYEYVMNELVENGMVVAFSAGNSGMWYDTPNNANMPYPYLYADDNNYATGGSPGSFTNTLATASVDNVGQTGYPLIFGDVHVFYSETDYDQDPIISLAGEEREYIFFENTGVDGNDVDLLAPYADAIAGKVLLCSRGASSFYQKVNAAAAAGAIGVVIYNNQPGIINMNLTGITTTIPAVSILQSFGEAIKAQSTPVYDGEDIIYYTGTMTVSAEIEVQVPEISDTVEVSSFSSYGTPGTMVLKPEILTPGGNIYSVWGANIAASSPTDSHEDYEVMSGTSMAAPQTAGLAAVLGQYIRENDLCEKTGLTARQLTNSLLMSTAHPVYDSYGDYWPVFRVGAGLANVSDAINAKSYILMDEEATLFPDSAKDGKVKAELGDDPDYSGEYSYKFTLYPLEESKTFTLRTDIFTQGIAGNGGYGLLQDTGTMLIGAEVTYELNGETYENFIQLDADVNMDGKTDEDDAQAILDHLTGELDEEADFDEQAADVDGDGEITTADARELLKYKSTEPITITEPTEITVNIKVDEMDKAILLAYYFTKGFYVEGYTYVDPVADEEGCLDVTHSIPIFGFCGSYTEPAMLERTSAIDEAYGTGKKPYTGNYNTNYLTMKTADGETVVYMGNPYMVEDEFPAEKLAMNSAATIQSFTYLPIRNVATLGFAVTDEEGNVLYAQASATQKYSAYYYVNGGAWQAYNNSAYNVGKALKAAAGVEEGDRVTVGFYALPEYYGIVNAKMAGEVAENGGLDAAGLTAILEAGILGSGAGITYNVVIDDTAPEVSGAFQDLITGDILVKASDENYIAYVAITNKAGSKVYFETVPQQEEAGEEIEVKLELEGQQLPSEVVLLVADYAGNESIFKVSLGGSGEDPNAHQMFGFAPASNPNGPGAGNRMWVIDPNTVNVSGSSYTGLDAYASNLPVEVAAAEYVDGYVFMAGRDGWFYVAPLNDMEDISLVGKFNAENEEMQIFDMAFNYANNKLYVLDNADTVYSMDLITGALTPVVVLDLGEGLYANRLAIDDNGVCYTMNSGADYSYPNIYKFELPESEYIVEEEEEEIGGEVELEGDLLVSWGFESADEFAEWTILDVNGDGKTWTRATSGGASGPGCLYDSYCSTGSTDDWAISPAFSLANMASAQVSLWVGNNATSYTENFAVYAGTSTDINEMEQILPETSQTGGSYSGNYNWTQHVADLSAFVGEEEVYVAVRHFDSDNQWNFYVDDVEIYGTEAQSGGDEEPVEGLELTHAWSFETEDEFNLWTIVNANNDSNTWTQINSYSHTGSYCLRNRWGYPVDDWAISPAFSLAGKGAAQVAVWIGTDSGGFVEHFAIYAGTSADINAMVEILPETTQVGYANWVQYSADLADFLGEEEVYVAIRHFNSNDMYYLYLDDVEIYTMEASEPEPETPVLTLEPFNSMYVDNRDYGGALAWDHNEHVLYLAGNYTAQSSFNSLWRINPENGTAAKANSGACLNAAVTGLFIVPAEEHLIEPTEVATELVAEPAELTIFKGQSASIKAAVLPWTLINKDVTFEALNPEIADVDETGKVTGIAEGDAAVLITSVALDENGEPLTAQVTVHVIVPPEAEIRGIIWDEEGKGQASVFNSNATQDWEAIAVVGQLRWGALVDDVVYSSTDDTVYVFDADTYEVEALGAIDISWVPSDAVALPEDLREAFIGMGYDVGPVLAIAGYGTRLAMMDLEEGTIISFNLSDTVFGTDPMALIAYKGIGLYDDGDTVDTEAQQFYVMSESGTLWVFTMNHSGYVMWEEVDVTDLDLTGVSDSSNSVWASMVYDEENEFLYVSYYGGEGDYAYLYAIDANDPSLMGVNGDFNESVWPVVGLYEYEPATDLSLKVNPTDVVLYVGDTAEVNIKIKLGETNEYTYEVADPAICSFEDGVITGLKAGETTITITTVDSNEAGVQLSKDINVVVKDLLSLDFVVKGQVTDSKGARFTNILLDGPTAATSGKPAPGDVFSGGRSGSIYLAGVGSTAHILDAETFEATDAWDGVDPYFSTYPPLDVAAYPTFLNEEGNLDNSKFLFTTEVGYLVTPDYSGWNLSSYLPDMAALCFAGLSEDESYGIYYLMTTSGILYELDIEYATGTILDLAELIDTGITVVDPSALSMAYVVDATVDVTLDAAYQAGIVIANNEDKCLWFIDFFTGEVGKVGILDADNVSGLIGTLDAIESAGDITPPEPPVTYTGDVFYGFYFEDEADVNAWTYVDQDSDGYGWTWNQNTASWFSGTPNFDEWAMEGTGCMCSASFINTVGALYPDNWMISPAIDMTEAAADATFTMYLSALDTSYYQEHFAVYVGTTSDPAEMEEVIPETVASKNWTQFNGSLADYVGEEEVYIAIRHFNCTDQYIMLLDNVEILVNVEESGGGSGEIDPWGFESDPAESGWTFFSNGDTDWIWSVNNLGGYDYSELAQEGEAFLMSYSFVDYVGASQADCWAISPAIEIPADGDATVSFYACNANADYPETFDFCVGTEADPDSMTIVENDITVPTGYGEWTKYEYDLSDYAGQTIYLGFYDYNYDAYEIWIDNIEIPGTQEPEPEPSEPDPWSFETDPEEAGWTFIGTDYVNWVWSDYNYGGYDYSVKAHDGTHFIVSASFIDNVGAYQADNWAISPAIEVPAAGDATLVFYATNANSSYPELFDFCVGTAADPESMTVIESDASVSTGSSDWTRCEYDLSDYAGQTIYLGFHDTCYDAYELWLDSFEIPGTQEPSGAETAKDASAVSYQAVRFNPELLASNTLGLEMTRMTTSSVAKADAFQMVKLGQAANERKGGVNALHGELTRTDLRKPIDETVVDTGTVQIAITEDELTENGLFTVTYDADKLTFADAYSELAYKSIHHEIHEPEEGEEPALRLGVITFAYASALEIPAEATLLTLNFTFAEDVSTTVVVTPLERNNDFELEEDALVIEIEGTAAHICQIAQFEDVIEAYPYGTPEHEAIEWAFVNGYTAGMTETTFGVGTVLTRAQTAAFLWAVADKPEINVNELENPFSDIKLSKWYAPYVLWAASEGLVAGYEDGTFRPENELTRAEVLQLLYAKEGKPSIEGIENPYSDAKPSKWFHAAALWAYDQGIERGADGKFSPNTKVLREVFVLYLYRYMEGKCLAE